MKVSLRAFIMTYHFEHPVFLYFEIQSMLKKKNKFTCPADKQCVLCNSCAA